MAKTHHILLSLLIHYSTTYSLRNRVMNFFSVPFTHFSLPRLHSQHSLNMPPINPQLAEALQVMVISSVVEDVPDDILIVKYVGKIGTMLHHVQIYPLINKDPPLMQI